MGRLADRFCVILTFLVLGGLLEQAHAQAPMLAPTEDDSAALSLPAEYLPTVVEVGFSQPLLVEPGTEEFQEAEETAPEPVAAEVPAAVEKMHQEFGLLVEQKRQALSAQAFADAWDKNKIFQDFPGLGRAELNQLNEDPFIRVVSQDDELAYLFISEEEFQNRSEHLEKYVARQFMAAGQARQDGRTGRNVVLVAVDSEGKVLKSELLMRPPPASRAWWRTFWKASYKKPTRGDKLLGVFCGVSQTGLAACVSLVKTVTDPGSAFEIAPAVLSAIYGTFIGTYASTYKSITNRGPKWRQTLKNSVVSLSFAYSLTLLTSDHPWQAINFFQPEGLLTLGHIVLNVLGNNIVKVEWNQFSRMREKMRMNTKELVLRVPYTRPRLHTDVNQANFESQMAYLGPFTLRLGDLTGIQVPIGGFLVPIGKLALWFSLPLTRYVVYRYAKSIHSEETAEFKEHWEDTKRLHLPQVRAGLYRMWSGAGEFYQGLKQRLSPCQELLEGSEELASMEQESSN